ncbi:MAG: O-antigen ligase family protein, partial [Terriglobales bacterium]
MISTTHARLFNGVVITGEVLVLGWLVATEDLSRIGLALLAVVGAIGLLAIASSRFPSGATLALMAGAAMPRFAATVFGFHARAEHLAIALAMGMVAVEVSRKRLQPSFELRSFDWFLIGYIVLNFVTSAATSPEPRMTLRWAALSALAMSPYFLMRILVRNKKTLFKALHIMLWVGAAEAAYGLICFLSNHIFRTTFGVEAEQYGFMPGTYGTQYEANLFGSYTACCAIMFLAFFVMGDESRRSRYKWGFAITSLGAVISLARSVFVAFPVAVLLVLWIANKKGLFRLRRVVPLGIGISVLFLAFSPVVVGLLRERFSTINLSDISSDQTTWERLVQMAVAVEDVQAHPVLGTGTASFHLFFDPADYPAGFAGEDADEPGWISNTPLRILHDTGVVGLTTFLAFTGFLLSAVRSALRIATGKTAVVLTALLAGCVLYAITFQATEATMLA